jgi:type IV fimbrial biogenesis protein FimT
MKKLTGFSILELSIVMAIITITAYLAVPSFIQWKHKHNIENAVINVLDTINYTRNIAIETDSTITMCPTEDQISCAKSWHSSIMVFKDLDQDKKLDEDDELLKINVIELDGFIKSESWFGSNKYLQMTPGGLTNNQNGRYTFCPKDGNNQLAQQIIVNRRGKARLAKDWNQDGIVDGSKGKPLDCKIKTA